MSVSRRDFLTGAVVGSLSLGLEGQDRKEQEPKSRPGAQAGGKRPIIVCAGNGFNYLEDAYKFLSGGGDTLDAALRVVRGPEDDPKDDSVGLGGLPILISSRPRHHLTLNCGGSACANWRRWPWESASNPNFVTRPFAGLYFRPPARFIVQP